MCKIVVQVENNVLQLKALKEEFCTIVRKSVIHVIVRLDKIKHHLVQDVILEIHSISILYYA